MKSNSRFLLILVISALFLSGCFQSMSNDADPTPISELFATPTPLPPSQTPQPTFTPFPSQDVVERVVTATPDLTQSAEPTPTSESIAFVTAEATGAQPTEFDALAADAQSEQEQQPEPTATLSDALQQATQIIADATQRAIDATETARGPITVPTSTPTVSNIVQPTATSPAPTTGTGTCNYTIRAGDNLFRLSLQYGVSVMDIVQANNNITNPQLIVVGEQIVIPGCTTQPTAPNQPSGTGNGATTGVNCNSGITHTVQQYETLFEISMQYGVTVSGIAACNNIPDPNFILMTTELVIPQ